MEEYTKDKKSYYQMVLGKFSKEESKSFDFMVLLNTDEEFAKKFYAKVFGEQSMMDEQVFVKKASDLYEQKYKSFFNNGDFLAIVYDNRQLIDRWFECGMRTLVRKF